jgi:hypothetical protein
MQGCPLLVVIFQQGEVVVLLPREFIQMKE